MKAVLEDVFDRHMRGQSPEDIELMYRRVYSSGFTQRPDPTVMGAFAGLRSPAGTSLARPATVRSGRFWAAG